MSHDDIPVSDCSHWYIIVLSTILFVLEISWDYLRYLWDFFKNVKDSTVLETELFRKVIFRSLEYSVLLSPKNKLFWKKISSEWENANIPVIDSLSALHSVLTESSSHFAKVSLLTGTYLIKNWSILMITSMGCCTL